MFRTLIQFLVSQKVDDGKPLGFFLATVLRFDGRSRWFYSDLLKLNQGLRNDASIFLEQSSKSPNLFPAKRIYRSVVFSSAEKSGRRNAGSRLAALILSGLFLLSLAGFLSHAVSQESAALQAATPTDQVILQSDPAILGELIQLCRTSPNEIGPFFQSAVLPIEP